ARVSRRAHASSHAAALVSRAGRCPGSPVGYGEDASTPGEGRAQSPHRGTPAEEGAVNHAVPPDIEPAERRTHELLANVPPRALPLGFRDAVMRQVAGGGRMTWEWIIAAALALPSLAFLAHQGRVGGTAGFLRPSQLAAAGTHRDRDAARPAGGASADRAGPAWAYRHRSRWRGLPPDAPRDLRGARSRARPGRGHVSRVARGLAVATPCPLERPGRDRRRGIRGRAVLDRLFGLDREPS